MRGRDAGVVCELRIGPRTRFLVPSGGRTRGGSDQRRVRWGGSQAYGVWPSGKGCGGCEGGGGVRGRGGLLVV